MQHGSARRARKTIKRQRSFTDYAAPRQVACVWLPSFAGRVERLRRPYLAGRPFVLVGRTEQGGEREATVRECSPEALACGLHPGLTACAVSQRCPEAVVLPFDLPYYQQYYQELLQALDALTPVVEPLPLEAFYLDLTGLPDLSVEHPERVADAVRTVIPSQFSPRVGVASGKFTAWVAANQATPLRPQGVPGEAADLFLRSAPSALLPVSPETLRKLDLLGLRTLGQIARLPRSSLLAQFGKEGERLHRLACGEDQEPVHPFQPPPVLRETLHFPEPASTVAQFELALEELLRRISRRPEQRNRGIRQVRLQAALAGGDTWIRDITLRRPNEHWRLIFDELRRRLEPVRPVGAMLEFSLEVTALASRLDAQALLFGDERQRRLERLAYELRQLRARLGRMPVYRIVEVEPWSRLPERRHALLSYDI